MPVRPTAFAVQGGRQHGHAILSALAVVYRDLESEEVDVLDPERQGPAPPFPLEYPP